MLPRLCRQILLPSLKPGRHRHHGQSRPPQGGGAARLTSTASLRLGSLAALLARPQDKIWRSGGVRRNPRCKVREPRKSRIKINKAAQRVTHRIGSWSHIDRHLDRRNARPGNAKNGNATSAFDRDHQRNRKREAVLRAAASAFNRRGHANTSLDDIAATLGVSKPTLYQYFSSKQEILYRCHRLALDQGDAGIALAEVDRGTGLDKLVIYLQPYMRGFFGEIGAGPVLTDVDSLTPANRRRSSSAGHASVQPRPDLSPKVSRTAASSTAIPNSRACSR
jgi:AcrR family transcriptional regulator